MESSTPKEWTGAPVYGSMRPVGGAPPVPGNPGGLPPELLGRGMGLPPYSQQPGYPPQHVPQHAPNHAPLPWSQGGPAPPAAGAQGAGAPEVRRTRVIVKQPRPRHAGGPEFHGTLPKNSATFAWSEACATREPDAALAPTPGTQLKSWYNTYIYVPEEKSHDERRFLDRFQQGPNGEWIDTVKAQRMASYMVDKREEAMVSQMEKAMVTSGTGVKATGYCDPYTGEPLVACRGELLPYPDLLERYGATAGDVLREMAEGGATDAANLRLAWPFGQAQRNKQVSQHLYDWFDRQNPYIPSDHSVELMELPSMYVERDQYLRYGAAGPPPSAVAGYLGASSHVSMQGIQQVEM